MIEVLFYEMHLTQRGGFLYHHFRPHLTQVQDAAGQELPCLPCQGVEGGETRARQPG